MLARLLLDRLKHRGWLGLFGAKFEAPTVFKGGTSNAELEAHIRVYDAPVAPGIWRMTDEEGERTSFRIIDQNGELYAKVRRVAVPVQNLPGYWIRVE